MLLNKTKKLALGSIITASGIILMLLTGVFPFAEYALPGIAGALMIILVTELGKGYSFLSFLAVAILSFILVPVKDSAVFYAAFLGWYPILKSKLESVKSLFSSVGFESAYFQRFTGACSFCISLPFRCERIS